MEKESNCNLIQMNRCEYAHSLRIITHCVIKYEKGNAFLIPTSKNPISQRKITTRKKICCTILLVLIVDSHFNLGKRMLFVHNKTPEVSSIYAK